MGLVLAGFAAHGEADAKRIYQRSLPSVMTLEVENTAGERFIGSAVLALANDTAITAWHVVSDANQVWATFADGTRVEVLGYIAKDGQRDLALIKLARPVRSRKATLSANLMEVASRAYVIGAPKGLGFSISDGLISQVRSVDGFAQYQVSCPISPGNSGGPLLNARGEVAGIVSWTKSDAQNVSFAIPCREVLKLNARGDWVRWGDAAVPTEAAGPSRRLDTALPLVQPTANSFRGDFKHFASELERLTGQQVTVVVRNRGHENTFTFTVPAQSMR